MNKWIERALFLNIILLLFFVLADYISWIWICNGLQELNALSGNLTNLGVSGNYWLLSRQFLINGVQTGSFGYNTFGVISNTLNLPLLVFVITIILNMLLIIKATRKTEKTTLPPPPRA